MLGLQDLRTLQAAPELQLTGSERSILFPRLPSEVLESLWPDQQAAEIRLHAMAPGRTPAKREMPPT